MECKLCGAPVHDPAQQNDGHGFCCVGCREVYRCFGDDILPTTPDPRPRGQEQLHPGTREAYLWVDGMHCSSCEILIERAAMRICGVLSAVANYATSTVRIVHDPRIVSESDLPSRLNRTGYRTRLRGEPPPEYDERQDLLRVFTGLGLQGVVMMLYLAFYYPVHLGLVDLREFEPVGWLAFRAVPAAILAATTILVFYVGLPVLRGAWVGLRVGVPNMDILLSLAILSAYFYSVARLGAGSLDLYFDVAATIVTVVTIGRHREQRAKRQATGELTRMMQTWAPVARVVRGGHLITRSIAELDPRDRVIVTAGETIPVDGTIVKGEAAIDESLMTGEAFPSTRGPGERVLGGAVVVEGSLEIETGATVESRMENLARILWRIQSSAAGMQGMADRFARVFVPLVLVLGTLVGGWLFYRGATPEAVFLAVLATLIVSCPCTFGLAVPLTTAVGVRTGLRRGIIIAGADTFEKSTFTDIIAIDKTGTLSAAEMSVIDTIGTPEVCRRAAAVERLSSHPIARAIARLGTPYHATDILVHPGRGATADIDGQRVAVGSKSLFASIGWEIPQALVVRAQGRTPQDGAVSYVGWSGTAQGAIITGDRSRPDWQKTLERLRTIGRIVLLTGAEHPGGYEAGVDEVHAGVPPEAKAAIIRRLKSSGTVMMIGDGTNDAPALAVADLGIAFGAPTALAAEAADVVIMGDRLERIFDALHLIRTVRRRIRQNIGWALIYNVIAIPIAMAGLLNPLFAALAMSASSILVVRNSVRPMDCGQSVARAEAAPATGHVWTRLRSST